MVRLRLFPQRLEEVKSFVSVSMFTVEDFPFRGRLGEIDRLLGGRATRLVQAGKLSGAWGSQAMLASKQRLAPEYVLFAGIGSRGDLTPAELHARTRDIFGKMMKASAHHLSMQVSGFAQIPSDFGAMATEMLNGAIQGASQVSRDVDIFVCEPDNEKYEELIALTEQITFSDEEGRELSLEISI